MENSLRKQTTFGAALDALRRHEVREHAEHLPHVLLAHVPLIPLVVVTVIVAAAVVVVVRVGGAPAAALDSNGGKLSFQN